MASFHSGADMALENLQTPCLLVDKQRMLANIARLEKRLSGTCVSLRPHLKTVKSIEAAHLALPALSGPAAVSTLKEAEEFGRQGLTDLLYAVCVSPQKLDQVSALRRSGIDLKIVVDSVEMAAIVAEHGRATADPIPVYIEIDVDGHRSGVPVGREDYLVRIGKALQAGAELRGVMAHAGESYRLSDPDALAAAAEQERSRAVHMAEVLRKSGLDCPVVSVGSTPTGFSARTYQGVTELRAGVYLFFDLVQAGIGVCRIDDIALSVLTTVIGHQREKNWLIIDAGWMALSSDNGTEAQAVNQYLGLVCDRYGRLYDDLVVLRANQEHGVIALRPGSSSAFPDLPIGTRLRILPNHACATAAQHHCYHVIDDLESTLEIWPRFSGW